MKSNATTIFIGLLFAADGWGAGVGRRYAAETEAKQNLDRLLSRL